MVDTVVDGLSSNAKWTQTGLSTARGDSPGTDRVPSDAGGSCSRTQIGLSSRPVLSETGMDTSTGCGSPSAASAPGLGGGGTRPSSGLSRGDSTCTNTGLSLGGMWTRPGGEVGVAGWTTSNGLGGRLTAGRGSWAARRDSSGEADGGG